MPCQTVTWTQLEKLRDGANLATQKSQLGESGHSFICSIKIFKTIKKILANELDKLYLRGLVRALKYDNSCFHIVDALNLLDFNLQVPICG